MLEDNSVKIGKQGSDLFLRVTPGHFSKGNTHMNYYIDITTQKTRLSEARAIAEKLTTYYQSTTIIDTILCLDDMQVIGTMLADELTKANFMNMNAHRTIYILTPDRTSDSQLLFRDNTIPMIAGKHILILAATVTTGSTAQSALEVARYYGGIVEGISTMFSAVDSYAGVPIRSVYTKKDLPDYAIYPAYDCPMCKAGKKIDALVNSHGYSKL